MKKQSGHGGKRKGAGRPQKPPVSIPVPSPEVDWASVERFANIGASEDKIVAGLGITEAQLKDPATSERLRATVTRGNALKDLLLQERIDKVGRGEARGGAQTLALEARERLGWDKQSPSQEPPPDVASAHARLKLTIERLARVKSEELGREVTPAELLIEMVYPQEEKGVH